VIRKQDHGNLLNATEPAIVRDECGSAMFKHRGNLEGISRRRRVGRAKRRGSASDPGINV
jgi:hypothetical protein